MERTTITKCLNFYPYYQQYLDSGMKTTTFRLEKADFKAGERVHLTVGWSEVDAKPLHDAVITAAYPRMVGELTTNDFDGESPDCKDPESAALVLSSIYRTIVDHDRQIWVVKFDHIPSLARSDKPVPKKYQVAGASPSK